MANLQTTFAGIKSPNPFWLASAPPTDKAYNVNRAFEAGWGGVVWKTLGEAGPPVVNVNGPRYGALLTPDRRLMGFNNIELITDRDLELNLREIAEVKRNWPDRAMIVSLMVPCEEKSWKAILPVIVKLTPNITDIRNPARAAKRGGADAVSLINTINSIMGVDPYTLTMSPSTGGKGSHGGYCGPAVKPIALNMVAEIARDPETAGIPISGIGGIGNWRDALDFIALGSGTVQVCTAAMVYGFKIVQEMESGLSDYMDEMGFKSVSDIVGKAVPTVSDWRYLNLNHISKAVINQDSCIQCGRCHIACEDTSHQAITFQKDGKRHFEVMEDECVGCNLCVTVCPVPDTITLRDLPVGEKDLRTGLQVSDKHADWTTHPNNPMRQAA
jgi:dihydropyrimidine dehydrogenase (NAD+) subunit PreA